MKIQLLFFILFVRFLSFSQIPNYVPTNGLVGWWPFTGNANDLSGNGNHGTVNGATLTTDRFGVANRAYSFTSGNSITSSPNLPVGNLPRSVSVWFQTTSLSYNTNTGLGANSMVTYGNGNGTGNGVSGQCNFETRVGNLSMNHYAQSLNGPFVSDGIWHNAVYTYDGTTHKLYLDNIIVDTNTYTINTGLTQLMFGKRASEPNWHPFIGKLDDIGIWNRALTQQEITALYTSTAGTVASLNCNGFTQSGNLFSGQGASNVSISVPYTGGNGGFYAGQTVSSTGVTGLSATLTSGTLANGSGTLSYTITGTPSGAGNATFALSLGGQSCNLVVPIPP